ncbi:DUF6970 domain-containing protein [Spirosoma rhododendri]|nr:hypothetical protein [Spirosoma rhododendri]
MNRLINCLLFAGLMLMSCQRDNLPSCVENQIKQIQAQGVWSPPAKIYQYRYQGRTVYFIPQRCCDIPSQLLDENCNQICSPDGGFTGAGDGRCSDFFKTRTDEKLIWEDTRR